MRRFLAKLPALCIILAIMINFLAGCTTAKQTGNAPQATVSQTAAQKQDTTAPEPLKLPIVDQPITLNYWIPMSYTKIGVLTKNYADMACYKEMEKKTGIHVNFLHAAQGAENEQINLMIASRDLPDMIYWKWGLMPGGIQKILDNKTIIPLNESINRYSPNFKAFLDKEPAIKKEISADDGTVYCYPILKYKQNINAPWGFMLRQDWLDKLNLKVPATVDEWYTVLKAFKEKDPNGNGKADEFPFESVKLTTASMGIRDFMEAWGITNGFYQVDGKVRFGPAQPEFREYLNTMRKWVSEGLIDPDYASNDDKQADAKIESGVVGAWYGGLSSQFTKYFTDMKTKDPNFKIVGAPAPVLKSGDKGMNFRNEEDPFTGSGAAITPNCKYPKEAAKWLDYHYSDEGHMLLNFGIEGVSYKMVNGYPQLSDEIINNPKGYTIDVALGQYSQGPNGEAQLYDTRVREQRMWLLPGQKDLSMLWNKDLNTGLMPFITYTSDESSRQSKILNEVNTYVDEMHNKFILGQESLDNYSKYSDTLKSMNVDEAVKIAQTALDRFNSRK